MNINGRLLLLVAVTALFARTWSVNSGRHVDSVSRARPAVSQNLGPWHSIHPVRRPVIATQPVSITTQHAVQGEEIWTVETSPIALPDGIAPGLYRVVDDAGRVARLEIAGGQQRGAGSHSVPADFHMTTIGGRRWYFIRLQPTTVTGAIRQVPAAVLDEVKLDRPAFTNPKFDFTGYCPAGSVVATIAEEFRPESPDLPVSR
jgi:hypothetical protein